MIPAERLKLFAVFENLPQNALAKLASVTTEEAYTEGESILTEGKAGDALYIISKGEVLIRKLIDKDQGTFKILSLLGPGEFFGEMSFLDNAPRSAGVLARTEIILFRVPKDAFDGLLNEDPQSALQFMQALVAALSRRMRQTTREMVTVFEVGRTLVQELDTRALSGRILALLRNSFEDDGVMGGFYYWNEFLNEFEITAFEGDWPADVRNNLPKDELLFKVMAIKRECLLSRDWARDERFSEAIRNRWKGFVSLLAAPIFGVKNSVGYIVLGHRTKADAFLSGHRQVLAGVANMVAPAFENAAWRQEMESKRRLERSKSFAF